MDFEKLYDKLLDFLKYNRYFLESFMNIPQQLRILYLKLLIFVDNICKKYDGLC